MIVGGFERHRRARQGLRGIFGIDHQRIARRLLKQRIVKLGLLGQARAGSPVHFQLLGRLDRLPGLFRHHADEVLLHHHFHEAGQALHRRFIHANQRCADSRRTHHAPVQHPRQAEIMDKLKLPGGHGGHVRTAHGLAQHGPFAGRLALGVLIEREVQLPAAGQFARKKLSSTGRL